MERIKRYGKDYKKWKGLRNMVRIKRYVEVKTE